jgi:hypothetical protein
MDASHRRDDERSTGPSGVDETRLLAGLRRTPRERLDHAVQVARVMRRFRGARRVGPLLAR